jgi:hypothetical protein
MPRSALTVSLALGAEMMWATGMSAVDAGVGIGAGADAECPTRKRMVFGRDTWPPSFGAAVERLLAEFIGTSAQSAQKEAPTPTFK